ncbi:response regulator transcription factor [Hymenobacter aquaticus]|uniref:Response regulator transcription factor n=1 Tax=Hymenobacter aquaticus TaxID=1867101 RepID=A0A4Z0Q4M7_9BACT|nr:LytTR family DNA-binding domain-containing protein [Hymenobacter aquaticus]TGE24977.1 response regulator transcription factor [Hymenobacter aquaticus]
MILNCIAVDDEPLALKLVTTFIEQTPFLRLVGSYGKAVEALRGISQLPSVDVIFLDIQMPDLNGLELARILDRGPGGKGPRIIFTTAFNQFALEGFRVDALDYLLKPFDYDEFLRAATKAKTYAELTQAPASAPAAAGAPAPAEPAPPTEDYIYLKVEYQLVRVDYSDILYIEGLKDYIKVYRRSEPRPLLSLSSLKTLEDRLPAQQFMRVHRSYIIALNHIKSVTRGTVQIGDQTIPVSDRYRDTFDQFFSRWK